MMPRIAPLPRDRWNDDVEAALRAGVPQSVGDKFLDSGPEGMRVPNAIASMLHHPKLAGPFLAYNAVLLRDQVLEHRQREIVVLRVAWRTRSPYEWVQHIRLGARYSITTDEVESIGRGADDPAWSPLEADLLRATDQLLDGYRIDDDLWVRLAESLDEAALIELLYVVGTYTCLAMVFNGMGVELDPEIADVPAPPLPTE
ncbi:MAG: carboxymuconolactone decarboxylase family protein [Frankiaceae bacterium]|nr:carboxymuconolactone decarboxylase family protein [Frankiaceae bacterium]